MQKMKKPPRQVSKVWVGNAKNEETAPSSQQNEGRKCKK
jgi:hypothetical protein